ncbi:MAG: ABC transporter permease [Haliscomenobacter sp.]|nr:ABC transporter permease [Haliscomenobacter sp.]MBP9075459.1 ABC transporter permease [Haliscomenobacter sp.]MBP9872419.1 ABC transporter permease [Haliscomenobacter sp.]
MDFSENVRLALRSIRGNLLRAILTLLIISFGIMALVGILTAIDSAIYSLNDNFSYLGANSFDIDPKFSQGVRSNRGGRRAKQAEPFSYRMVMDFKEQFQFPGRTAISLNCTGNAALRFENEKTNPNVLIMAIDENYLEARGFDIEYGRNFSAREVMDGGYVTLLGQDVVSQLFNNKPEDALDKVISAGNMRLRVIGILKKRGSSMSQNEDKRILIPLQTGKRYYGTANTNYNLMFTVNDATELDNAIAAATGVLRNIRKLKSYEDNDFEFTKSDSLVSIIKENTVYFRLAAVMIGLITLLGAAIGLMNIMLVSVTERTREVGISKALGATQMNILWQFLSEAVVISLLGGLFGILLGVMIGNLVTYFMGGLFRFPWLWITVALVVCTVVGLVSGLYPALKAARLDPIESLRYE